MISRMQEIKEGLTEAVRAVYPRFSVPFVIYSGSELISRIIREWGWFSQNDLRVYDTFLTEGDLFVDVGANIGWYSVYASFLVGPKGSVIAIEPDPLHAQLLRKNGELSHLAQLEVVESAVGSRDAEVALYRCADNFGDHCLLARDDAFFPGREKVMVPMTTVDRIVSRRSRSPRLIKIDIQGAEGDLFAGMRAILNAPNKPIFIIEFSPGLMLRYGSSPFEMFAFIEKEGYIPFHSPGDHTDPRLRQLSVEDLLAFTRAFRDSEIGWDLLLVHRYAKADLLLCQNLMKA